MNINSNDLELALNKLETDTFTNTKKGQYRNGFLEGVISCRVILRRLVSDQQSWSTDVLKTGSTASQDAQPPHATGPGSDSQPSDGPSLPPNRSEGQPRGKRDELCKLCGQPRSAHDYACGMRACPVRTGKTVPSQGPEDSDYQEGG